MGWWKIKNIETGQVDFEHKCPTSEELVNAVPGEESEDALYNGDGPADLMGSALRLISVQYKQAWTRPPKKDELTAVFNFCLNGMFRSANKGDPVNEHTE